MTKKYIMLVKNDAARNNNKFYEVKLEDDDQVIARYGRVGAAGVTEHKGHGEATFDKVVKAKTAGSKGYREVAVAVNEGGVPASSSAAGGSLAEIAKRDIANGDTSLHALLDNLAKINRFQLLAASGGQIDIVDGEVKTALGVMIPLDAIAQAKTKLNNLATYVKNGDTGEAYVSDLQDYLTIIPQKIPTRRGWDKEFFTSFTSFENQHDFLEQLENSVKNSKPVVRDEEEGEVGRLFGYSLETVDPSSSEFVALQEFYTGGVNRIHVASNRKLVRVYKMINDEKRAAFDAKSAEIGNVQMLWHGTRAHNILSILKGGLIIPPTTGGGYTIAGRMFGNGVYFSDQSTKSLNYSAGYWGSGGYEKGNIFMLNASVAMGKPYTPRGPMQNRPAGYDSIYAIGGKSGVQNNEMIVDDLNQFSLDYLCEFE